MAQKAYVNCYLILIKDDTVLLSLRKNTGYEDGKWSLLAGHCEENESVFIGMIREAQEESNIILQKKDLQITQIMHRKSNRENIDIFMRCTNWKGEILNNEPHKCDALKFYKINELPINTIPYVRQAILNSFNGVLFLEDGYQ